MDHKVKGKKSFPECVAVGCRNVRVLGLEDFGVINIL